MILFLEIRKKHINLTEWKVLSPRKISGDERDINRL